MTTEATARSRMPSPKGEKMTRESGLEDSGAPRRRSPILPVMKSRLPVC